MGFYPSLPFVSSCWAPSAGHSFTQKVKGVPCEPEDPSSMLLNFPNDSDHLVVNDGSPFHVPVTPQWEAQQWPKELGRCGPPTTPGVQPETDPAPCPPSCPNKDSLSVEQRPRVGLGCCLGCTTLLLYSLNLSHPWTNGIRISPPLCVSLLKQIQEILMCLRLIRIWKRGSRGIGWE